MSTIIDVAKKAGVSKTTVSKILSGKGNVRPATLEKVNQAMKELDYIPSGFAQIMRTGTAKNIAVLLPEQFNHGYSEILRGIEMVVESSGYIMTVCSTGVNAENQMDYLREMVRRQVDGILFFSYARIEKNVNYLLRLSKKVPIVVMDNILKEDEPISMVRVDGYNLTRKAAQYLIDKGRTRIGYIRYESKNAATLERYEGYLTALKENGIKFDPKLVREANIESHITAGFEQARVLMHLSSPPTAIMTVTDMFAIGVIDYLREAKIKVPQEVCVMGFDDIPLCNWLSPKLTTASQGQLNVGRTAAKLLFEQIQNPEVGFRKILLPGDLIIRDTA
ncbi:MAG: LacI family transcriptional regulator [Clostridiales bacterium]|nr:LacI family transcriptional regulator [Clostridiales bacterium]